MLRRLFALSITIVSLAACGSVENTTTSISEINPNINSDWAKNSLWDDGLAEVAKYDAQRVVYGKTRNYEYVYVLVKEVFNEEFAVKTDDYSRSDLYDVLKINKFCKIETEAYPYHYLTSVFVKREQPDRVHKLTNTSQEWCGNTAKSFTDEGNDYLFQYMSYWDGQGNGEAKVKTGVWFEDQLSYTLRALKFKDGLSFEIDIYPSQISSKATLPTAHKAVVAVEKSTQEELAGIDGSLISSPWRVTVKMNSGLTNTYWFNGTYPNLLLKMESTDGRSLSLTSTTREAYWEKG